jgi:DNA methylase/MerR HTH family regulatory protein
MQMTVGLTSGIGTSEVARRAGVHRDTLLRWLRSGLVKEPARDRHGWRLFSTQDLDAILNYARSPMNVVADDSLLSRPQSYVEKLSSIDWDFDGAKTNYLTHRLHPYPAKFIPQIPNALIQELSSVGETVGDIFCGSGTTLVEALTLKRNAVGIDANPLACLIANAKTGFIDEENYESLRSLAYRSREFADEISRAASEGLFPLPAFTSTAWRPDFPKLPFWFASHVIEELAEILSWCRALSSQTARNLALTSFSAIIVAVSHQDSDTRYVRRDKGISPGDTMKKFARTLEQNALAAMEYSHIAEPRFQLDIIEGNLLDKPRIPKLDLMVCSPPYPNAYSYHLYHMTRMIWLEMDQPKFKKEEIGSHRKYSNPSKSAATVDTFREEFTTILVWLAANLKAGGRACFVVGNSTLKGQSIDNARLIKDAGVAAGFVETMCIDRTMQSTKKSFNPAIGKIKREQILVLENRGA